MVENNCVRMLIYVLPTKVTDLLAGIVLTNANKIKAVDKLLLQE